MLKRTILFQSAGYISLDLNRLCFQPKTGEKKMVPIEDLGIVLLESLSLTISTAALNALMDNNVCVILCDAHHLPCSMMLPITGNTLSQKIVSAQLSASEAMKKRLWKQTVQAKIRNQAACLEIGKKENAALLRKLAQKVQNGDPENVEGTAARFYFRSHSPNDDFLRDPAGEMPNPALNYGYAVIRAAVARALVSSGL